MPRQPSSQKGSEPADPPEKAGSGRAKSSGGDDREARLAARLRENLKKRKQQARDRKDVE